MTNLDKDKWKFLVLFYHFPIHLKLFQNNTLKNNSNYTCKSNRCKTEVSADSAVVASGMDLATG